MEIGKKLLTLLKKKGHTQKELAEAIGASTSTVNNWIKLGRSIPSEYIIPICGFLGVSYFELLGESGEPTSNQSITISNQSPTINNSSNIKFTGIKHSAASNENDLGLQESTKVLMKEVAQIFDKLQPRQQVRLMSLIYDFEEKCRNDQTNDSE